ncbi:MAG: LPS assembly lipoprotein LptE [Pseudomonadota bacterium]
MSWFDRRRILRTLGAAGLVSPLAACFRPMLAEQSTAFKLRGRIALPQIDNRLGYHLYQSLESRLGKPGVTDYALTVGVRTTSRGFAVAQDNSVTRISVTARANWALYAEGVAEPVLSNVAISESGYNSTDSLFATRQAELDIERRLAEDLGERISRAILARADQLEQPS